MASSPVPLKAGGLAELLVNDFAKLGFARGAQVQVLEVGSLIKFALGASGIIAYLDQDSLRALRARPAAVPHPPLAQPVPRAPQVQRQNAPGAEEPLLHFLCEPSRLICLRLVGSEAMGQVASNLVDTMLHIVGQHKSDIKRDDKYVNKS